MAFTGVTNAHGPSHQPIACRSPTCLRQGFNLLCPGSLGWMGEQSVANILKDDNDFFLTSQGGGGLRCSYIVDVNANSAADEYASADCFLGKDFSSLWFNFTSCCCPTQQCLSYIVFQ